jgi:hypothetical protein
VIGTALVAKVFSHNRVDIGRRLVSAGAAAGNQRCVPLVSARELERTCPSLHLEGPAGPAYQASFW